MITKRREPLVLFLDDGFDSNEAHTRLTAAGFTVERFRASFRRDGRKQEGIPDPPVYLIHDTRKILMLISNRHGLLFFLLTFLS